MGVSLKILSDGESSSSLPSSFVQDNSKYCQIWMNFDVGVIVDYGNKIFSKGGQGPLKVKRQVRHCVLLGYLGVRRLEGAVYDSW